MAGLPGGAHGPDARGAATSTCSALLLPVVAPTLGEGGTSPKRRAASSVPILAFAMRDKSAWAKVLATLGKTSADSAARKMATSICTRRASGSTGATSGAARKAGARASASSGELARRSCTIARVFAGGGDTAPFSQREIAMDVRPSFRPNAACERPRARRARRMAAAISAREGSFTEVSRRPFVRSCPLLDRRLVRLVRIDCSPTTRPVPGPSTGFGRFARDARAYSEADTTPKEARIDTNISRRDTDISQEHTHVARESAHTETEGSHGHPRSAVQVAGDTHLSRNGSVARRNGRTTRSYPTRTRLGNSHSASR